MRQVPARIHRPLQPAGQHQGQPAGEEQSLGGTRAEGRGGKAPGDLFSKHREADVTSQTGAPTRPARGSPLEQATARLIELNQQIYRAARSSQIAAAPSKERGGFRTGAAAGKYELTLDPEVDLDDRLAPYTSYKL